MHPEPHLPAHSSPALTHPAALYALTQHIGDPVLVKQLATAYPTWAALAHADRGELSWRVGAWAAQLRLPPFCPALPDLPADVTAVSFTDPAYPGALLELPDHPTVLFIRGYLPVGRRVAIDGALRPSASGRAAARAAGAVAARRGLIVVASLDSGCGRAALRAALGEGGTGIGVASADVSRAGISAELVDALLATGGAVISEQGPGAAYHEGRAFAASRLVAALGDGAVLAELGTHPTGGAHLARAVIALGRYLIVPDSPDAFTGITLSGTAALARPTRFSSQLFGSSPRLAARVAANMSPADAVVSDAAELEQALAALADAGSLPAGTEHSSPPALPAAQPPHPSSPHHRTPAPHQE